MEGWRYATHGGTAFVVDYAGRHYAITCEHVRGDFDWKQLLLTDAKFGKEAARLKSINRPSDPTGGAVGSDILDLVVIEFIDGVGANVFGNTAYILDEGTVGSSRVGDALVVNGALKDPSNIDDTKITPVFARLEFTDCGVTTSDPAIRQGVARYVDAEFARVTGLSGSPVFNTTTGRLCGVVARGDMRGGDATIYYIDIFDVMKVVEGVRVGASQVNYNKVVGRAVS